GMYSTRGVFAGKTQRFTETKSRCGNYCPPRIGNAYSGDGKLHRFYSRNDTTCQNKSRSEIHCSHRSGNFVQNEAGGSRKSAYPCTCLREQYLRLQRMSLYEDEYLAKSV